MLPGISKLAAISVLALTGSPMDAPELPLVPTAAPAPFALGEPACEPVDRMPLEGRASPYDSASVHLGETVVKVCYGRPSARGRTMIGGEAVPFGQAWRTGANEPTTLHVTTHLNFGDVSLDPGSYSIYTIPGEESWVVVVNRSTDRWGIPIDDGVREHDVGSFTVPREEPGEHVETMTIRFEERSAHEAAMVLEWENFRIRVPIHAH